MSRKNTYTNHTCKNCGTVFSGSFCNACGEKVYTEKDKSLLHFFEDAVHFITHFEGTLFTTLKTIFTSPGKLSLDYCNGIRKKYFKPLPLFLLLIVLYLLFPFLEGLNMQLKYYSNQPLFGNYAAKKIETMLATKNISFEELSTIFHTKSEKVSKFLMIVILPLTALVFYLIGFNKRKYYFDHLILATEINSFYLIWGFLILPLLLTIFFLILRLFSANVIIGELIIGFIIYIPTIIYSAIAARRFYGFKWLQNFIFVSVFTVSHMFIVYSVYKFLLFVTVINQIH